MTQQPLISFSSQVDKNLCAHVSHLATKRGRLSYMQTFLQMVPACLVLLGCSMNARQTLHVTSRREWRSWLSKHYKSKDGIWLAFHRKSSGEPTIGYDEAVEEAICFGWIDVQIRRIDDHNHMRRFTPRRQGSNWSDSNKRRALRMLREGKMTGAGRSTLPPDVLSDG